MRTGREDLGDHGSLVTALSQLQRSAHAGTAATDDDGVEGNGWNASHGSDTPENLHTPDEVSEHRNAAYRPNRKRIAVADLPNDIGVR